MPNSAPKSGADFRHVRFGLCCVFAEEPIKFRTTTALALSRLAKPARMKKLSDIALDNTAALGDALRACDRLGIRAFRVLSTPFPRATHPDMGYGLHELPESKEVFTRMASARALATQLDIRLSFHPDQFVVLSSPNPDVVEKSIAELEHHAEIAEAIGADVINIHGGGAYGDKAAALGRFEQSFARLSAACRARLTLENDDTTYAPSELLPLCKATGIPLVYDVHHHRCLPDTMSVAEATKACFTTWKTAGREPFMHISSPREGWVGGDPKPHHEYIAPPDFPEEWRGKRFTVDVEARAKELAVTALMRALGVREK